MRAAAAGAAGTSVTSPWRMAHCRPGNARSVVLVICIQRSPPRAAAAASRSGWERQDRGGTPTAGHMGASNAMCANVPTSPVRPMTRWPRAGDGRRPRPSKGGRRVLAYARHTGAGHRDARAGWRKRRALLLVGGIDSGCTTPAPTGAGRTARSARDSRPRPRTSPRCTDPGRCRDPGGSRARGHKSPATHPHAVAHASGCAGPACVPRGLRCPPGTGTWDRSGETPASGGHATRPPQTTVIQKTPRRWRRSRRAAGGQRHQTRHTSTPRSPGYTPQYCL